MLYKYLVLLLDLRKVLNNGTRRKKLFSKAKHDCKLAFVDYNFSLNSA